MLQTVRKPELRHDTTTDWRQEGPCVMIVDDRYRLIDASPSARLLLGVRDGLELLHGVVRSACASDATGLMGALRSVRAGEMCEVIVRGRDAAPVSLALTPLKRARSLRIAIVAETPGASDSQRVRQAIGRFGLTDAEGRVLARLCEGKSLPQVAAALSIAPTTARTHLQRVFDKTGERRQSALVRLVLTAPAADTSRI